MWFVITNFIIIKKYLYILEKKEFLHHLVVSCFPPSLRNNRINLILSYKINFKHFFNKISSHLPIFATFSFLKHITTNSLVYLTFCIQQFPWIKKRSKNTYVYKTLFLPFLKNSRRIQSLTIYFFDTLYVATYLSPLSLSLFFSLPTLVSTLPSRKQKKKEKRKTSKFPLAKLCTSSRS